MLKLWTRKARECGLLEVFYWTIGSVLLLQLWTREARECPFEKLKFFCYNCTGEGRFARVKKMYVLDFWLLFRRLFKVPCVKARTDEGGGGQGESVEADKEKEVNIEY